MSRARYQDPSVQTEGKGAKAHYFIRVRVYNSDGTSKRIKKVLGLVSQISKREVSQRKREAITEATLQLPKGDVGEKGETLFSDFYRDRFLVMKSHWSEPHREGFSYIMDSYVLPKFGRFQIGEIDKVMVQGHLNGVRSRFSESTIKHIRTKMVEVFEEAVEQEYISKNPAARAVIPSDARPPHQPVLTQDQLYTIIDRLLDKRDNALFHVATFCALRTSEVFGMPWGNFHHNEESGEGYFLINQVAYRGKRYKRTKTDASRARVHLGPRTLSAVLEWKAACEDTSKDALMFPSTNKNGRAKKGAPMCASVWLQKRLRPATEGMELGFHVNFRATRRTAATLVQDDGHSLATAQSILRHASPVTTGTIYTKPILESVKRAVNDYETLVFSSAPIPKKRRGPSLVKK